MSRASCLPLDSSLYSCAAYSARDARLAHGPRADGSGQVVGVWLPHRRGHGARRAPASSRPCGAPPWRRSVRRPPPAPGAGPPAHLRHGLPRRAWMGPGARMPTHVRRRGGLVSLLGRAAPVKPVDSNPAKANALARLNPARAFLRLPCRARHAPGLRKSSCSRGGPSSLFWPHPIP